MNGPQTSTTAPRSIAGILAARCAARALAGGEPRAICLVLSDSVGGGTGNSANIMGFRRYTQEALRSRGDGVRWIGEAFDTELSVTSAVDGWASNRPGALIEELYLGRAATWLSYAALVASIGQPDVIVFEGGTNDAASESGAAMLVDTAAALDSIHGTSPSAFVLVVSPPPSPTASPNQVAIAAYVAGLPALVASRPWTRFSDAGSLLDSLGDKNAADSPAYTHPNAHGARKMGRRIADDLISLILPPQTGPVWPRPYETTPSHGCLGFAAGSPAYALWGPANAKLDPGSGNWAVALQVYFTTLPAGLHSMYCYGAANPNQLLLLQDAALASIFVSNVEVIISAPAAWRVGVWQSIVVAYDATAQIVSLWIDGKFKYHVGSIAVMAHPTGEVNATIGSNPNSGTAAIDGFLREFVFARGSLVPGFDDGTVAGPGGALRRAVEAYHVAGAILPGAVEHYPLAGTNAATTVSDMGGAASSAWSGTVTATTAATLPTPYDE